MEDPQTIQMCNSKMSDRMMGCFVGGVQWYELDSG